MSRAHDQYASPLSKSTTYKMVQGAGIEPALDPNLGYTDYKSVGASSYTNLAFKLVSKEGLEPSRHYWQRIFLLL